MRLNKIKTLMRGDFILVDKKLKNMRFLFFVVGLLIINISVTFECQSVIIDISKKEKDINELRLKSITTKSQLASLTKRTEIEKIVREIKLFTSTEPNYILENAEK
tara:strand:- start:853 stop:1170 length:318 start_codon:yes stop_codon:yes gene_type:complete